jgi:hypothetical protein
MGWVRGRGVPRRGTWCRDGVGFAMLARRCIVLTLPVILGQGGSRATVDGHEI